MNVQKLNKQKTGNHDNYKSLLLLDEISKGENLSQRDLSKKLNIALGLVNSYIKNLISKGYITIKTIPSKRYAYYLTPKGFAEKSRLTYYLLQDYTRIFREARRDFSKLFGQLIEDGTKKVVFAGVDEVAEIAYLSLQEANLELVGVFDNHKAGHTFFNYNVRSMVELLNVEYEAIIITSFQNRDVLKEALIKMGIHKEIIIDTGG